MNFDLIHLFDVSGTLTGKHDGGPIDENFKAWLIKFSQKYNIAFISGGDPDKVVTQIGPELLKNAVYTVTSYGNQLYHYGVEIYKSDWNCTDELENFLKEKVNSSQYSFKNDQNNLQKKIGRLRFSVIGTPSEEEMQKYFYWDKKTQERKNICDEITSRWFNIETSISKNCFIDIFPRGADKRQVLHWIESFKHIKFFGDTFQNFGNDTSLAELITKHHKGETYDCLNWQHTQKLLLEMYPNIT